jgi:site-specific DNA recombinase
MGYYVDSNTDRNTIFYEANCSMKSTVIYTRVSSREQQQEGFSLGAQTKGLREYADRGDFNVIKAFEDVETAKTSGRKQFNEMVKWLKQNPSCPTLLVEKTDRLYRNFRDAVTLEDLDLEIHFVKEGQVLSKDAKSIYKAHSRDQPSSGP